MRKWKLRRKIWGAVLAFFMVSATIERALGVEAPTATSVYETIALSRLEQAKAEVAKIKVLVEQDTVPRVRLAEAQNHLADAQDELILARTLYGSGRLQDMTAEQAAAMTDAARRRVERQEKIVRARTGFVESGILARSDMEALETELASRRKIYELAQNRVKLLDELRQMAEAERRLEAANGPSLSSVMTRYEGSGIFRLSEMQTISKQFEQKFHRPLPVSALGQTSLHQSMGLDHHGRVDVALNPNGPEGLWLRGLLERLRIPYLAFRSAFAGAATAPHIHIGSGSPRLSVAQSPARGT